MTQAMKRPNQNSIKGGATMEALENTNPTEQKSYTAENTKLFSYTGSKAKYKAHFDSVHSKLDKGVKKVNTYIEVFAGTLASMFHNLHHIEAQRIIINDFNPRIINLYKQIKSNPTEVFELYNRLEETYQSRVPKHLENLKLVPRDDRDKFIACKDFYYEARAMFNQTAPEMSVVNAALFLFVANHNFNGMYTESKKTGYNVSFNWSSKKINLEQIETAIDNLHKFFTQNNVVFENIDAFELIKKYVDEAEDTFIYLDPPYSDSTIQYQEGVSNFNAIQTHLNLIDACNKYKYVMYSNAHEDIFTNKFDSHMNFSRTNRISTDKSTKSNLEILAIKTNIKEVKAISILEIIEQFNEEFVPANTVETKKSISAITPSINTKIDTPTNNVIKNQPPLKVGTAFSGIGAPEQALKEMDIKYTNEYMIEIDKFARKTYLVNHSVKNIYEDITTIEPKTLPYVDLFVFGSPCQSFSLAGKRGGFQDTRGTLIFNGLQIIKETQPKYFIYENVKGLLSNDKGKTFQTVINAFNELGYNFKYKVLNTKNFGLPQNRERVFIVGTRKDIKNTFTFPTSQPVNNCVSDFITKGLNTSRLLFSTENKKQHMTKHITDIKTIEILPLIKYEADRRIYSTTGISPTIRTGGQTKFYDEINKTYRYLNTQELASLQGFDKDFIFPVSKAQTKKQIGNSISVPVIKAICENLLTDYITPYMG